VYVCLNAQGAHAFAIRHVRFEPPFPSGNQNTAARQHEMLDSTPSDHVCFKSTRWNTPHSCKAGCNARLHPVIFKHVCFKPSAKENAILLEHSSLSDPTLFQHMCSMSNPFNVKRNVITKHATMLDFTLSEHVCLKLPPCRKQNVILE
jgi:hypothetical protein